MVFFYFFPFLPPSPSAAAATAHHKHSRNFNDPSHCALAWIRACFWTLLDTPLALASCQGTLRDLCDNLKFPLKSVCQQFELQTIIQAENIPFSFHIFVDIYLISFLLFAYATCWQNFWGCALFFATLPKQFQLNWQMLVKQAN